MDFYMKLPRNSKEFALFLGIVAVISVNIIAPVISGFEVGFSLATWRQTLTILPVMLVAVVIFVLLTHMPAEKVAAILTEETDSFNAKITITILINVAMMSVLLGANYGMNEESLYQLTTAAILHDIGKAHSYFQDKRLKGEDIIWLLFYLYLI